jgi:hypothetical protein
MKFKNAVVLTTGLFVSGATFAGAIVPGFDSNSLERGTAHTPRSNPLSGVVDIGFTVNLNGMEYSGLYVNQGGYVAFNESYYNTTASIVTMRHESTRRTMIVPFGDTLADTRYAGSPVTYGEGTYDGHAAFGVNWVDIDYYAYSGGNFSGYTFSSPYQDTQPQHIARNSFQLVIVDRSDISQGDFDFIFNYDTIQWQAGTPRIGWAAMSPDGGVGAHFEAPSQPYGMTTYVDGGTDPLAGQSWLFQVRNGVVSSPIITTIPEPETWAMLLAGLGIVGAISKRRRRQG